MRFYHFVFFINACIKSCTNKENKIYRVRNHIERRINNFNSTVMVKIIDRYFRYRSRGHSNNFLSTSLEKY
jgi:hypothetical protein